LSLQVLRVACTRPPPPAPEGEGEEGAGAAPRAGDSSGDSSPLDPEELSEFLLEMGMSCYVIAMSYYVMVHAASCYVMLCHVAVELRECLLEMGTYESSRVLN